MSYSHVIITVDNRITTNDYTRLLVNIQDLKGVEEIRFEVD